MTNRSLAPYAWMLCGCFAFAWMGQFAHQLGSTCDWRIVALARSFLALCFALMLVRLSGSRPVVFQPGILWVRSCAGSLSLLCTFYALPLMPTSEVLTLTNTFPIWVALLSWPLLRERPTLGVCLAACCGVVGILVMQMQQPHQDRERSPLAVMLALTAAVSSAVAMLGLHRLKGIAPSAIVAHFSGVATLFVSAACLLGQHPPTEPLRAGSSLLLLLGVGVSATLGQLCLTRAFTAGEPAKVSVVGLSQVLFALALDSLFAESPLRSPTTLAGIGLVLAPTAWVMTARPPA